MKINQHKTEKELNDAFHRVDVINSNSTEQQYRDFWIVQNSHALAWIKGIISDDTYAGFLNARIYEFNNKPGYIESWQVAEKKYYTRGKMLNAIVTEVMKRKNEEKTFSARDAADLRDYLQKEKLRY